MKIKKFLQHTEVLAPAARASRSRDVAFSVRDVKRVMWWSDEVLLLPASLNHVGLSSKTRLRVTVCTQSDSAPTMTIAVTWGALNASGCLFSKVGI